MKNAGTYIDKYGETTVTHLVASTAPIELLQDQNVNLISGASENPLDKQKIIAIKSFEELIGFRKMYKPYNESCFRKIHYDILTGNFFSIFGHLAGLSNRKELIDNGIYRLVRYGVIELDDARIVFGSALLIDAFLPKSWAKAADDAKTDTRKVAYYLEQPEEVLYRLRKISDETSKHNQNFLERGILQAFERIIAGNIQRRRLWYICRKNKTTRIRPRIYASFIGRRP